MSDFSGACPFCGKLMQTGDGGACCSACFDGLLNADTLKLPGTKVGGSDPNSTPEGNTAPLLLPEIPGLRIVSFLGRGGMGVVWLADQLATGRKVAVKFIRGGAAWGGDAMARARFEREIELAARLDHPNIARVFDGGEADGEPYCVMEFVEGSPVDEYARKNRLRPPEMLELMRMICEAVDHAHRRGVLHRDLKPTNILVTAEGMPKLLDFGLARAVDGDDRTLTGDGALAGTPAYMSPEQARGDARAVDTRSDIYSLGVLFYRMLTGCFPYAVEGPIERVLGIVARSEVARPRSHDRSIAPDLEMFLLHALARLPGDRYASAGEMAEDIGRYLRHEPLAAGRTSTVYFVRKWVARHRFAFAAGIAALAGLTTALTYHLATLGRERNVAEAAQIQATASLHRFLSSGISEHMQRGDYTKALELIREAEGSDHPSTDELNFLRIEAKLALSDLSYIEEIDRLDRDSLLPQQKARLDFWRAQVLLDRGDSEPAMEILRQAITAGLPPMENSLAQALTSTTLAEAIPHYAKATALAPWRTTAQRDLALALLLSGRVDEARTRIRLCHLLFPGDGGVFILEALLEAFQGNAAEAKAIAGSMPDDTTGAKDFFVGVVGPFSVFAADLVRAMYNSPRKTTDADQFAIVMAMMKIRGLSNGQESIPGMSGIPPLLTRSLVGLFDALNKFQVGDGDRAAAKLRETLAVCDEGMLWAMLGTLEQLSGNLQESLDALRKAQATPSLFADVGVVARLQEGVTELQIWIETKDPTAIERAVAAFRDFYRSDLPLEGVHQMALTAAMKSDDLLFARQIAEAMPRDSADQLLANAKIEYADGNSGKALIIAEKALALFPNDAAFRDLPDHIRSGTLEVTRPDSPTAPAE